MGSPSTRRAWVEIEVELGDVYYWGVALYAEGVGRNLWQKEVVPAYMVALYAEGVGRNRSDSERKCLIYRRPLRGGRG